MPEGTGAAVELQKAWEGQPEKVVVIAPVVKSGVGVDDPPITLNINGANFQLPVGVEVTVAESVADLLLASNYDVREVKKGRKRGKSKTSS